MALKPITRQEQIIAGKDLAPITRMEKFLKQFGGGGGASSWNDLADKPFETIEPDGFTIAWDGNTDGLVCVKKSESTAFYKVSNATPTDTQIRGAVWTETTKASDGTVKREETFTDLAADGAWENWENWGYVTEDFVCMDVWIRVIRRDSVEVDGLFFPEAGTYFRVMTPSNSDIQTVTEFTVNRPVVNKLDPTYLPNTNVFMSCFDDVLWNVTDDKEVTADEFDRLFCGGYRIFIYSADDDDTVSAPISYDRWNNDYGVVHYIDKGQIKEAYTAEYGGK